MTVWPSDGSISLLLASDALAGSQDLVGGQDAGNGQYGRRLVSLRCSAVHVPPGCASPVVPFPIRGGPLPGRAARLLTAHPQAAASDRAGPPPAALLVALAPLVSSPRSAPLAALVPLTQASLAMLAGRAARLVA